jgi:sugar phosphate isomerase/epimerase
MRVGLQTISWSTRADSIGALLREMKRIGYDGLEVAQLREDFAHGDQLFDALTSEQLSLIGVAGGTLDDKLAFVADFAKISPQKDLPFIYADEWDESLDRRYRRILTDHLNFGARVTVGIHPHMFKPVQTAAEADILIQQYDYLRLLPDIAHLTVAGDNVLSVLDEYFDSIVAVHLKDWSPEFGRTFPFYSRGFVELGNGRVPVATIVNFLKAKRFPGWLVVEQDFASNPRESAKRSRQFLRELGV